MSTSAARPAQVKVDIQLLGRTYGVACEAGEEKRLEALAGYLDSKLRTLAGSMSSATESRLFMLAALMLADEVYDLKAAAPNARHVTTAPNAEQEAAYVAAVEHLTDRLQKITQRLNSI